MIGLKLGLGLSVCRRGPSGPPPVLTGSFADGQQGSAYSQSIPITSGTAPYSAVLVSGDLPPTLTLHVVGTDLVLEGTEN